MAAWQIGMEEGLIHLGIIILFSDKPHMKDQSLMLRELCTLSHTAPEHLQYLTPERYSEVALWDPHTAKHASALKELDRTIKALICQAGPGVFADDWPSSLLNPLITAKKEKHNIFIICQNKRNLGS